ncbi:major facilitator superfamily domain-containing protein [Lophiotrema nucula]|uniref:Major facilitator superfamily domain-containing protein n=1 Tax=Lophiotrema nucula TaxID=690887 RepID=A0A6A5ZPT0_9PLEO|nr:major facilitator superfamily domain-containing protein [Lophiotrema nucula]
MALIPPRTDEVSIDLAQHRRKTSIDDVKLSHHIHPGAAEANVAEDYEDEYPEGGSEAWLVVFGAWCSMMLSMGLLNTVGVLQAWVLQHQLSNYSEFSIGWIFSVYAFFLYIAGAQVGPIFDAHDVRWLIIPGTVGFVAAMMFLSVCKEYYQFFLSFGVLGGISACCLFNPAISAVGHWFNKRRALATGIACTAGGTGGIFFPLIILYLAPKIGFPWAIRIIGFICAVLGAISCCCLRKRLPHNKKAGASIDLRALKDRTYAMTTVAVFLVEFAVFIPYTYISSYAIHSGVEPQHAYLLMTLLNTGAIPGRAIPGYVADRFGHFNVMCVTSFTCATFIFALWLTAGTNEAAITAFAVVFGFWSGAAISLTPVCVGAVCKTEDVGKRIGTTFSISSFGALIGIPIAGAIVQANGGSYTGLIIFAGASYLAAFLAFLLTRIVAGGWDLGVIF